MKDVFPMKLNLILNNKLMLKKTHVKVQNSYYITLPKIEDCNSHFWIPEYDTIISNLK